MSIRAHLLAAAGAFALAVALAGCESVVYVPAPAPPAAPPAPLPPPPLPEPPPPVLPPPVVPPPAAPVPVAELVARLAVGSTAAEAAEVFGRPPDNVAPETPAAPGTLRWFVEDSGARWMVYALMRGGKVTGAGSTRVEVIR